MTLNEILAKNLLRFNTKNINYEQFARKFINILNEQGPKNADVLAGIQRMKDNIERAQAYQAWKTNLPLGATVLFKTAEYVPMPIDPKVVEDVFYSNFVTLEKGLSNPDATKAKLKNVIEMLKQQGLDLTNPKMSIKIESTATELPAGTRPRSKDFPGGKVPSDRLKLDHNYGGKLIYDQSGIPTAASVDWAKTNNQGNYFLAEQRGQGVKKYFESIGVTCPIVVTSTIVPNTQKRRFIITGMQEGTEKVISPIETPEIELTVGLTAKIGFSTGLTSGNTIVGGVGNRKDDYDSFQAGKAERAKFDQSMQQWQLANRRDGVERPWRDQAAYDAMLARQARGQSMTPYLYLELGGGFTVLDSTNNRKRLQFELQDSEDSRSNSIALRLDQAIQIIGQQKVRATGINRVEMNDSDSMGSIPNSLGCTGNFTNGGIGSMLNASQTVGSKLLDVILGKSFNAWLSGVVSKMPKQRATTGDGEDGDPQKAINAQWASLASDEFSADAALNFKQLIAACVTAGVTGVAAQKQTDISYWRPGMTFYYDETGKGEGARAWDADYGALNAKTAPKFFAGAKFSE